MKFFFQMKDTLHIDKEIQLQNLNFILQANKQVSYIMNDYGNLSNIEKKSSIWNSYYLK